MVLKAKRVAAIASHTEPSLVSPLPMTTKTWSHGRSGGAASQAAPRPMPKLPLSSLTRKPMNGGMGLAGSRVPSSSRSSTSAEMWPTRGTPV